MIKFQIEVWLHSHYETKKLDHIDVLGITALYQGRVPLHNIVTIDDDIQENIDEFKGYTTEECYTADIELHIDSADGRYTETWYEVTNITKAVD